MMPLRPQRYSSFINAERDDERNHLRDDGKVAAANATLEHRSADDVATAGTTVASISKGEREPGIPGSAVS